MNTKVGNRKIISVILAAGKGTRMQTDHLHKVCHTVDKKPVIKRMIEGFDRCGLKAHNVIVGHLAEQVKEVASTAGKDIQFCLQRDQRGTGHAAKIAANHLKALGYSGNVLLVAADKVIEDGILTKLINKFFESDSDLAFLVGKKEDYPSSGRVLYTEQGDPKGIIEVFDIVRVKLFMHFKQLAAQGNIPAKEAKALAVKTFTSVKKAAAALGSLWEKIEQEGSLTQIMLDRFMCSYDFKICLLGEEVPFKKLQEAGHVNLSVYLFKSKALYHAVSQLSASNAQGEEYLTDVVEILSAGHHKLIAVMVDNSFQVKTFNTLEELQKIQRSSPDTG